MKRLTIGLERQGEEVEGWRYTGMRLEGWRPDVERLKDSRTLMEEGWDEGRWEPGAGTERCRPSHGDGERWESAMGMEGCRPG